MQKLEYETWRLEFWKDLQWGWGVVKKIFQKEHFFTNFFFTLNCEIRLLFLVIFEKYDSFYDLKPSRQRQDLFSLKWDIVFSRSKKGGGARISTNNKLGAWKINSPTNYTGLQKNLIYLGEIFW